MNAMVGIMNLIDFIIMICRTVEKTIPHVILNLKEPTEAVFIFELKKTFQYVAIRVDEPDRFKEAIQKKGLSKISSYSM